MSEERWAPQSNPTAFETHRIGDTNFRCSLRTHVGYVNIVCNLQKLFRVFTHLAVFRNVNS